MKYLPVDLVLSHIAMHEDELCALSIGRRWGRTVLPGFESAPVHLIDAGLHPEISQDGDYYLVHERTACIGVMGGPFDEHAQFSDGVRRNAATKMAAYVGVRDDPALAGILEYSLRADRDGRDGPFELASLIKSWWAFGMPQERVLLAYSAIFDALYRRSAGIASPPIPPGGFRALLDDWLSSRFPGGVEEGNEEVAQIIKFSLREEEFSKRSPYDLEGIWEALAVSGMPKERIRLIIFASLDAKCHEQKQFMAALDEFNAKAAYLNPRRAPYRVAIITSDNQQMKRAARIADSELDVLIQRRQSGRVNVFDLGQRLYMDPVVARLRIAEREKKSTRGPRLPMEVLLARGTLQQIPEWFSFFGANNGTITAPNTPVTKLSLDEIVGCVAAGLVRAHRDKPTPSRARLHEIMRRKREQRQRKVAKKLVEQLATTAIRAIASSGKPRLVNK